MATRRRVEFPSNRINIVADLYFPTRSSPDRKHAAIAVSHPFTSVKEQTAGLHARRLAENGFVAICWDAAFQGESGGDPRGLEDPYQRVEDLKCAVTFLSTLGRDVVDPDRIGVLGICGSGGYASFAAQTDQRMKAVATVSALDLGRITREGLRAGNSSAGKPQVDRAALIVSLRQAGHDRVREMRDFKTTLGPGIPLDPAAVPAAAGVVWKEASEYFRIRDPHPRSTSMFVTRSSEQLANFDAFHFNAMISPRPLLMIVGSEADTTYHTEDALAKAKEPKEMFVVKGRTHMDLYDDLTVTIPKLVDFMSRSLCY